jgi:glycosyltransferase involved in cell wall biosynthesis
VRRGRTPLRRWSVAVVIPARDEEATIEAAVGSVRRALRRAEHRVERALIVVVADTCVDDTVRRAERRLGRSGVVLTTPVGRVGASRALGTSHVLGVLSSANDRLWLANTDADSVVRCDWILRQLVLADRGATCVSGIVRLGQASRRLRGRFAREYGRHVGAATHTHVHGANLGIRGDLMSELGNWAPVRKGEDHDLWHRAGAAFATRHQDPRLVVTTSARKVGRAPGGFAADLVAFEPSAACAD